MTPIASVERFTTLLSTATSAPTIKKETDNAKKKKDPYAIYRKADVDEPKIPEKKVYTPKYVGKNLNLGQPTMAPPWISGPGGFPTTMNSIFEQQTTWVIRLVVKRIPRSKSESFRSKLNARYGVISLVDLSGNADKKFYVSKQDDSPKF